MKATIEALERSIEDLAAREKEDPDNESDESSSYWYALSELKKLDPERGGVVSMDGWAHEKAINALRGMAETLSKDDPERRKLSDLADKLEA